MATEMDHFDRSIKFCWIALLLKERCNETWHHNMKQKITEVPINCHGAKGGGFRISPL